MVTMTRELSAITTFFRGWGAGERVASATTTTAQGCARTGATRGQGLDGPEDGGAWIGAGRLVASWRTGR